MQCCWFNSSFFVDAKRLSDQLGFVALWFPCYGLSYLSSLGITWDPSRNPQPARGLRVATMALFNQEEKALNSTLAKSAMVLTFELESHKLYITNNVPPC